jgi:diguanylate cyclase (GGDEF)-like protein/PAS domain S-box-containing protein
MTRASLSSRIAGPVVVAIAGVMFALFLVLRLSVTVPGFGFTLLYCLPVALIAVAFGSRAGLAAAVVGLALFAVGDATEPIRAHGIAIYTNAVGYMLWALVFILLGGLLGVYSDRARRVAERFEGLVDAAPDAMVIVDEEARVVLANVQARALLGYTCGELLELTVEELLPERFREQHAGHRTGFFGAPHARPMGVGLELYALHKDGREIPVEISLGPLQTEQGTLVSAAIRDVSERRRAEAKFRGLLESAPDAMVIVDERGVIELVNAQTEVLFGYRRQELVGQPVGLLVPERLSGVHEQHFNGYFIDPRARAMGAASELSARRKDGTEFPVEISLGPLETETRTLVSAAIRDVTDRKRAELAVQEAEERFRRAFDEAPIGMAMLDLDDRFVRVNDAMCEITGYTGEQLEATSLGAITHPDDLGEQEREIARVLSGATRGYRSESRLIHAGGRPAWVALQATVSRDHEGDPLRLLVQVQDITDRRRYEERLRHMADHDALTGLLNRRGFERELESHRARTKRYGCEGTAIVLDLDHFKFINDTVGHTAGDEVIARVAEVLRSRVRETDVLARLGGDEFAVLLPRADAPEALHVANDLIESLRAEKVELRAGARPLAASAGVAAFESEGELSGEDVLVNADLAMYDAKNAGRDRAELYVGGEQETMRMKGRVTWAQRITGALEHGGFTLLAQPIFDLSTRRPSQYELLLRMRDEDGDLVPPGVFIYTAERLGMVQQIDRWVTGQAITLLAERQADGEELTLEVNLSGLSIGDPKLLALISCELERTNVPPNNLIFETTETAAVTNMTRASQFARELTHLGCRFALDDFGAGYGSFYYLKHLPFDFLKIDGEFVKGCRTSETDRLLIKAVVDIATGLGKRTIAEFVDDEDTAKLLSNLGVDYGQGFHLGRPAPLNDIQTAGPRQDTTGRTSR